MKNLTSFLLFLLLPCLSMAQQFVANYDESKMPAYTLPDPLVFNNGTAVVDIKGWDKRRTEIYSLFEKEVFGVVPKWKGTMKSTIVSQKTDALGGLAKRKEVRIELINGDRKVDAMVLIYLPQNSKNAPIFLGQTS